MLEFLRGFKYAGESLLLSHRVNSVQVRDMIIDWCCVSLSGGVSVLFVSFAEVKGVWCGGEHAGGCLHAGADVCPSPPGVPPPRATALVSCGSLSPACDVPCSSRRCWSVDRHYGPVGGLPW